ncbi:lipid-A-disaccharide synthase [Litoribrevibacter albus]|uniref:Lipid-A-disaccharide synthase n=2 Tax=Litoribrevibacter albus TaxID=1473156 RepID=A0AA37W845_9GAMM|nr:lipid-A-disaccharide synthase [Litoribrevibacter albus]
MIAGEASGDILGSGLIKELRETYPDAIIEGIGGPLMIEQGFNTHFPMERLSVMGLVEVLGRLRELIGIHRKMYRHFKKNPPDVFIGIDAPDFTLRMERKLKKLGVPTVHYVSPSVWAWRKKRIFKIKESTDLMLTLLPFESKFYQAHNMKECFVGHPLADDIPMEPSRTEACCALGLDSQRPVVAILPGSRGGEIKYIGETMLRAADLIHQKLPDAQLVLPAANEIRRTQLEALQQMVGVGQQIKMVDGQSRTVMAAANVIALASGTATLEAALHKRPMVVVYKMAPLTYAIGKRIVKVDYISLPNLLANKPLVPELIQDEATPEAISEEVIDRINHPEKYESVVQEFHQIHELLQQGGNTKAARAVLDLIGR